jgi:CheY-like chemotaxis protein
MKQLPSQESTRSALRLLIVEDEALISMLIEQTVRELGHEPAAFAHSVPSALNLVDAMTPTIDAAMLDVNLGGSLVFPVAEALSERGIPFAFLTGYGAEGVPARYSEAPVMQKPFRDEDLALALDVLQQKCSHRDGAGA